MKQLLLLAFFIPTLLWAQENPKYLSGAVPEQDGKVVFTKEIKAPALSTEQIYDITLQWAKDRFSNENSRVVYNNKEEGNIAAVGEEYLVFQNSALSLDRANMSYRVTIECKDNSCTIKVNGIRYEYNVSYQREPEKYLAEEWITDKYAMNKNKTKLYRGNGKFRTKTIDFVDELFQSAASALGMQTVSMAPATQSVQVAAPLSEVHQTPAAKKEGYVAFTASTVPSTLLQMLPESDMQIVSEKEAATKETSASWKGIGNMFGKSIASVTVSTDSPVYKSIKDNDAYNISFFKKGETETAWLIIECRKVGETADGNQKTVMGEVINVWVK